MDVAEVREIYDKLPTQSKFVEVYYRNQYRNREARPGYIMDIMDMAWEDIPEEHRSQFRDGNKHPMPPYITLGTFLDRNQCPKDPVDIRIEDIIEIRPAFIQALQD